MIFATNGKEMIVQLACYHSRSCFVFVTSLRALFSHKISIKLIIYQKTFYNYICFIFFYIQILIQKVNFKKW